MLAVAGPLHADDRDGGFLGVHTVAFGVGDHDTGVFGTNKEAGLDVNGEVRFAPLGGIATWILSPQPHLGFHYNTAGDTSQIFGGLTWMWEFGWGFFGGGSVGLALHDGELSSQELDRKSLGSRVLFRESIEIGYRITERHGVSLMLDHISHGTLLADENEGLDTLGIRFTFDL